MEKVELSERSKALLKLSIFWMCFTGIIAIIVEFIFSFTGTIQIESRVVLLNMIILFPLFYCACRCYMEWGHYADNQENK